MTTLATLVVKVVGDINEYTASLEKSQQATDTFSNRAVSGLSALGGSIVMGGLTAAATATTAIGVAAWNASETMDKAYDTIQIQTGATGDKLKALQGDFDTVFAKVPTDAQQAADVISALNQKLGQTGPSLDADAIKLLNMTNLLGGDAKTNAELFGRAMQDAGLPLDESGNLLDKLFVASQKSGIGVDSLMQKLVQFGAPMRNMGFDLDTSIALFAKWEKEGVNAELVMGSLRIAAGNFAKEGKPLNEGLAETIEQIKGAKDASEALTIAQGVFGARAAGDMAAAIREGRFDIQDLTAALQNSQGAINKTAESTLDWDGKWKMFTNNLTMSLSPIGDTLREIASKVMDMLNAFLSKPEVQQFIKDVADGIAAFGETVQEWIPQIQGWLDGLWKWLGENQGVIVAILAVIGAAIVIWAVTSLAAVLPLVAGMMPMLLVLVLIGVAAYILYLAWTENWGGIREKSAEVWAWLQPKLEKIAKWFREEFPKVLDDFRKKWDEGIKGWQLFFAEVARELDQFKKEKWEPGIEGWQSFGAGFKPKWDEGIQGWQNFFAEVARELDQYKREKWEPGIEGWKNFNAGFKAKWDEGIAGWKNFFDGLGREWDKFKKSWDEGVAGWQNFFDGLDRTMKNVGQGFDDLIGKVLGLNGTLNALTLPDWLTPGSPTPWEIGLGGINREMALLAGTNLPEFNSGLKVQQSAVGSDPSSLSTLGTGIKPKSEASNAGGVVIQVNVDYHPLVSGSDERELAAKLGPAILAVLKQYKVQLNS